MSVIPRINRTLNDCAACSREAPAPHLCKRPRCTPLCGARRNIMPAWTHRRYRNPDSLHTICKVLQKHPCSRQCLPRTFLCVHLTRHQIQKLIPVHSASFVRCSPNNWAVDSTSKSTSEHLCRSVSDRETLQPYPNHSHTAQQIGTEST